MSRLTLKLVLTLISCIAFAQEEVNPSPSFSPSSGGSVAKPSTSTARSNSAPSSVDALVLYNSGQYHSALVQTERELNLCPKNMDARAIRSWTFIALKRFEEAEKLALESLRLSPSDVRLIEVLGEAYFYQDKLDKALNYFAHYIELAPQGVRIGRVYSFIGDIYTAKNKIAEAEFAYTAATVSLPSSVPLWLKIGESRLKLNSELMAKQAFERVLQISPTNTQASEYLKNL